MGDGPSRDSAEQSGPGPAPSTEQDAIGEELAFGGEPGDLTPPAAAWNLLPDQPTQISRRPPIEVPQPTLRPADLEPLLVGQRLEHFEIQELIGGGGMGAVFRALDTRLNRTVAIKVLPRDQAADEEVVRRFRNEAQSAARLDHDHIVRVYYVGEDKGHHFIAFEFVDGRNLRDIVLDRGPLSVDEALNYTLQIADALAHASGRDVVHRDIKPSNVLIAQDGRAKLADMGLARFHQIEQSRNDLTASGVTLGTFDYISPEQARDPRNADVRSDIYSLGCTLYFMVTGRPPFPEGTVLQKLLQHQGDEPPDASALNPDVPPAVSRLIRTMMAKDPRARQQTPEELVAELAAVAQELGIRLATADTLIVTANDARGRWLERHLVWMIPVAALALIVMGLEIAGWRQSKTALNEIDSPARSTPSPVQRSAARPPVEDRTNLANPADPVLSTPRRATIRAAEPPVVSPSADAIFNDPRTESDPLTAATPNPVAGLLDQMHDHEPAAGLEAAATLGAHPSLAATAIDGVPVASASSSATDVEGGTPATLENGSPQKQGILIVAPSGAGQGVYPTLQAACAAAEPGAIIELRYHGRAEENPIDLRNQRLTIRSGEGFRPVVVFRPREIDPARRARSMVTMLGGRLTLVNLAIELDLPREAPSDGWALFRLQQAETLRLEGCSLTIRNATDRGTPYHENVAFIRVMGSPGSGSMMGTDAIGVETISIQMQDCIARGEATFLSHRDVQPCWLSWRNGLLATTDRLLESQGGLKSPRPGDLLKLELRHLTADVRGGLCLLTNTTDAPYQLTTQIALANSIILGTPASAMIEQSGVDSVRDFHRRLVWESERNFYDGFRTFWKIRGLDAQDEPQVIELSGWLAFWRGERSWGPVAWKKLPGGAQWVSTVLPLDYSLDPREGNAALRGATDGRDAGCDFTSLPQLPAEPQNAFNRPATSRSTRDVLR